MTEKNNLTFIYKQNLEDNIIQYLSKLKKIDFRKAMSIYYQSRLAKQISRGEYGIENMDYKYLVQDMIENEPEIFYSCDDIVG